MTAAGPRVALAVDLSTPDPIPEDGIARAVALMRSGRLFRYGEERSGESEAARLEVEFARYVGRRYAVAVNSCGSALFIALECAGVRPGDRVLLNAFTLAPVPGAVAHAAAEAVLVDITDDYTVDLADLERKAGCGARVLLLSHMRGHIADMEAVASICRRFGLTLVEDCAHTLGAGWNGRPTGTFGAIGCFSAQTFKHLNSGEGGILVTDDDEVAARAILYSGSYALCGQHLARPPLEVFERVRGEVPNFSMRMSALAAAVLRAQLPLLPERIRGWNERYAAVARLFAEVPGVRLPRRPAKEQFVGSSIQFSLPDLAPAQIERFLRACDDRGVHVKWFGARAPVGFTSAFQHWGYLSGGHVLPRAPRVLATLCDMRLSLALSMEDCRTIGEVVRLALSEARAAAPA